MNKTKTKVPNNLLQYRRRLGLSQERVVELLGIKSRQMLSNLEAGRCLPKLTTAFQLSAIYRVPVEFLFKDIYEALRDNVRRLEKDHPVAEQGMLAFSNL